MIKQELTKIVEIKEAKLRQRLNLELALMTLYNQRLSLKLKRAMVVMTNQMIRHQNQKRNQMVQTLQHPLKAQKVVTKTKTLVRVAVKELKTILLNLYLLTMLRRILCHSMTQRNLSPWMTQPNLIL